MSTASGATGTLLAKRVNWLVQNYQHEKPKHRSVLQVQDGGKTVAFQPGKLLDLLKKCFLPDASGERTQTMSKDLREQCLSLWWFQGWLNELQAKRQIGNEDGPPDLEEQVHLLIHSYPTVAPRKGEAVTVERINGSSYELNGHSLLEKIAPNFHGEPVDEKSKCYVHPRLQQQLLVLPWSNEWLATGRKRREVARMRKLVTKEMKVELLLFFHKEKKPAWKSRIPVIVPDGSGEIFEFYPGTWLDDLGDNFLKEARPNVVLSDAQMIAISKLAWFDEWIASMREQRLQRASNRTGRKRMSVPGSPNSDTEDSYTSDVSQQENTPFRRAKLAKLDKATVANLNLGGEEAPMEPVGRMAQTVA